MKKLITLVFILFSMSLYTQNKFDNELYSKDSVNVLVKNDSLTIIDNQFKVAYWAHAQSNVSNTDTTFIADSNLYNKVNIVKQDGVVTKIVYIKGDTIILNK